MRLRIEKMMAWLKWAIAIFISDCILKFLFAPWIYPLLVYPFRKVIRHLWYKCGIVGKILAFPGFIFLNDPEGDGICDDYGIQEYRNKIGFPKPLEEYNCLQKWWISYRWSGLRNNNWNIHRFIKPKYNDHSYYEDLHLVTHSAYNDRIRSILDFCVIKYKDKDGNDADNFGDIIDYEKSILGKTFIYYRVGGVLYFRYSRAWVDGDKAREIQLGTNGRRFKIRIKSKKLK